MTFIKMFAFAGFMICAIALTMNGFVYLAARKIMSYHCGAMEKSWGELSNGTQTMCLCFMKSAAAGMLSAGIGMVMLLLFPYRSGELWSEITLSLIALLESGILASMVAIVRKRTKGRPALELSILLFIVAILSTFIGRM